METKAKSADTRLCDPDLNEEVAGILTAISIVSKRLAKKVLVLRQDDAPVKEGGKFYGQND